MKRTASECTGVYQRVQTVYEAADYAELVQNLKSNFDGFALIDKMEVDARSILSAHSIERPDFPTGGKGATTWTDAYELMQEAAKKSPIVGDAWDLLMTLESIRKFIAEENVKQAVCHAIRAGTVYEKMRVRTVERLAMKGRKNMSGSRKGGKRTAELKRAEQAAAKKRTRDALRKVLRTGLPMDAAKQRVAKQLGIDIRTVRRHTSKKSPDR